MAGKHSFKFGGIYATPRGGRFNVTGPVFTFSSEADVIANRPSRFVPAAAGRGAVDDDQLGTLRPGRLAGQLQARHQRGCPLRLVLGRYMFERDRS